MYVIKTNEINNKIKHNPQGFVLEGENRVISQIENAANEIVKNANEKPIIMIAGPSGSSKTTTAIKLANCIKNKGFNVCYISMDNYFKTFTAKEKELDQQGKLDLESPSRLDVDLLNHDIEALANNETIKETKYDFVNNVSTATDKTISRNGGFVIIEGIHALNEELFSKTDDLTNRIYVSVRTRVVDSSDDKLHPSKIRMLRRMMRDSQYRNRPIEQTIKMYPSVQRGENKFIMPYKSRSNFDIDTFIEYEPNVYKEYLFEELVKLAPKYADIRDVVIALDELHDLDVNLIPKDAMIREFIGGSSLEY